MLLDRVDKEDTDHTRIITDLAWWLDTGETIADIVSAEVVQGMGGWSEAPYPPPDSPPPYDPTPVILTTVALDASKKQVIVFVQHGTAGVAYTLQFVVLGTSQRELTYEIGVQVTGVPPEEPLPLPPLPSDAAGQEPGAMYLNIKGGIMQGPLYLFQTPKYSTEAVNKHYVDNLSFVGGPFMSEAGGTFTGPVTHLDTLTLRPDDPVDPLEATSKQYVDSQLATLTTPYLPLIGGTLIGPLELSQDPQIPMEAANKRYVDGLVGGPFLLLAGGNMTGPLLLNADPVNPLEAATMRYVDARARNSTRHLLQWNTGNILADGIAYFIVNAPYAGTINNLTYLAGVGSFNASIRINGVVVGGLASLLVNSATAATANATSTNTFSLGQYVEVVIGSAAGSPTNVLLSLVVTLTG